MNRILHLFLILAVHLSVFSQELPTEPNPGNLKAGWWEYFDIDGEDLEERISTFQTDLKEISKTVSEEGQSEAETSAQQIINQLNNYAAIRSQPPIKPPTPKPFAKSYSIEELMKLQSDLRKEKTDLNVLKKKNEEEKQKVASIQKQFDQRMMLYQSSEERSEKKLLTGLRILSDRVTLEVTKKNIEILTQKIDHSRALIKNNTDEVNFAIAHLVSSPEEESDFDLEISPRKLEWEKKDTELDQAKLSQTGDVSNETGVENEIKNQYLSLQVIQSGIREKIAYLRYIRAEMGYQLARLLNSPQDIDIERLFTLLQNLEKSIDKFNEQSTDWENQTRQRMQQAVEQLSIGGESAPFKDSLEKNIQLGQDNVLLLQKLNSEIQTSFFLADVIDAKIVQYRGIGERWYQESLNFFLGILYDITDFGGGTLFYISQTPVTILSILQFLLIMIVTIWGAKFIVRTLLTVTHKRKGIRKGVVYRLSRLIYYFVLFVGLIIALTFLGFNLTNIFLIAGALGVGIGFGLQTIFNNFISGIIILFQSNLRIGDFVELESGIRGEIREINVSSTMVATNDGIDVLIPNSEMISNHVINWTLRDPYRRVHIPFGVAYGTNVDKMVEIVVEAAKDVQGTLKKVGVPEPIVYMKEFGESSLDFELVVWVDEKLTRKSRNTKSRYLFAIEKAFNKNQIKVPFPQREVHIISPDK